MWDLQNIPLPPQFILKVIRILLVALQDLIPIQKNLTAFWLVSYDEPQITWILKLREWISETFHLGYE